MNSILNTIKLLLGIDKEYHQFDVQVLACINTAMASLTQLGVGPKEGMIVTSENVWSDFIDDPRLNLVISYVHLKVWLLFDSANLNGSVIESINKQIGELEFRILAVTDYDLW